MRILQVFNRYLERGGEEKSVERIANHLEDAGYEVIRFWISSEEWIGSQAPSKLKQLCSLFYNREFKKRLADEVERSRPDLILAHNVFPIASPAIYHFVQQEEIPFVQFIHNFRPFSVGATLWLGDRIAEESLQGSYWSEVKAGAWQNSRLKSALMAGVLKNLHARGWLDGVTHWIAISDFMREKFIEAGIKEDRISTLRHAWSACSVEPLVRDGDYYLFLGRMVPEKGLQLLMKSWEYLYHEQGEKAPKLIVAGAGPEEQLVREVAERIPMVEFRGFVSGNEKEELIRGCRAMLAPSVWWEPLGLVTYS